MALSNLFMPKQMVFNIWYLVRVIVRYASLETHCTRFSPDGCRLPYMKSCHLSGSRDASVSAPGEGGCHAWEQCMQLLISRLPTRFANKIYIPGNDAGYAEWQILGEDYKAKHSNFHLEIKVSVTLCWNYLGIACKIHHFVMLLHSQNIKLALFFIFCFVKQTSALLPDCEQSTVHSSTGTGRDLYTNRRDIWDIALSWSDSWQTFMLKVCWCWYLLALI